MDQTNRPVFLIRDKLSDHIMFGYIYKKNFLFHLLWCVLSVNMLVFLKKMFCSHFFQVSLLFVLVKTLIKPKPLLMSMSLYLYSTVKTTHFTNVLYIICKIHTPQ